jgi:hypothetical protein
MNNINQLVLGSLLLALIALTCSATVLDVHATSNNNSSSQALTQASIIKDSGKDGSRKKAKEVNKPRDKSLLDAEVLASPIAYLRNAFSSEEDESEVSPDSSVVVITVKALIATLLSTIM